MPTSQRRTPRSPRTDFRKEPLMAVTLNDLGKTLLAQLYQNVTGGDNYVPPAEDAFISWAQPGIPFHEDAFQFAVQGLSSSVPVGAAAASGSSSASGAASSGSTAGSGGTATAAPPAADPAAQLRLMLQEAYNFATIVDYIPDVTGTYNHDRQQTILRSSQERMSEIYGEILKFSKVVNYDLTADQQAKLKRFRGLLTSTTTVTDIVTGDQKQVTGDSPMLKAYKDKMAAYIAAALQYRTKRAKAQSASGQAGADAVADWANNADLYRLQVKEAMDDWTNDGYKNDVDEISAYINQTTQRSMMLWKQGLQENYNDAIVNGVAPGQSFYYTTVIPGDFATAGGWTNYTLTHDEVNSQSSTQSNSYSGSAGLNFGFFSVGGSAAHSDATQQGSVSVDDFTMSFDMCQVVIARPWFYPEWFLNRGWTLRKGEGWMYDEFPSDGGGLPATKGNFIGYSTTLLFIKNLKISSQAFADAYRAHQSSTSGGGSVGWGPISLGGTYSHASGDQSFNSTLDGATLSVDGMQLIGTVNHLVGKAPNPLPDLKDSDFA
jgi:hypothetical protein